MARWYEDAEKLEQKREEAGVSAEVLAQRIGRHPSYVHEVEAERIPLVSEVNAELIWSTLIELGLAKQAAQLPNDKIVPPNLTRQPFP